MQTSILKRNIFYLIALQAVNFVMPLLVLPHITRTLAPSSYGNVALAFSLTQYATLIAQWGFNWTAVQRVAEARSSTDKLQRVFRVTWTAQWLMFLICIVICAAAYFATPTLRDLKLIFWCALVGTFGSIAFPLWFLQGMEDLKFAALTQILVRLVSIPFYFILISAPSDANIAALLPGVTNVICGAATLAYILRRHGAAFFIPCSIHLAINELRTGAHGFLSQAAIAAYTAWVPTAIGLMSTASQLAFFSLADKFRVATVAMLQPISQALYPRLCHLHKANPAEARSLLFKIGSISTLFTAATSVTLFVFARYLMVLFGGSEYQEAGEVLRILAWAPLPVVISNTFGIQDLLARGKQKKFNQIVSLTCAMGVALVTIGVHISGAIGAASGLLAAEIIATCLFISNYVLYERVSVFAPKELRCKH